MLTHAQIRQIWKDDKTAKKHDAFTLFQGGMVEEEIVSMMFSQSVADRYLNYIQGVDDE